VLGAADVDTLLEALGSPLGAGRRGLLATPEVAEVASSVRLLTLVRPCTGHLPRPVRAIYFDKSPTANWLVAWHQDVTVAVEEQMDVAGFGPWSVKHGVPHAQAPVELLENMITVRVHLDDCDETNGALRVLPGTHLLGRLSSEQIQKARNERKEVVCGARRGDVMLMRPLLLHASGKSVVAGNRHRRVLHIEYAGLDLPGGLRWRQSG
jgi:hypothetical protein